MSWLVYIALLAVCLFFSACFSGVETALFSLDRSRLRELQRRDELPSRTIQWLLGRPHSTLITILVGNLLVNTAASSLATAVTLGIFGEAGLGIAIGAMTFLLLVVGEITPKTYAYNHAVAFALRLAVPLRYVSQVLAPLNYALRIITQWVMNAVGRRYPVSQSSITEDEMRTLFQISEREGLLDPHERDWINNIFRLSDLEVNDVMRPAAEAFILDGALPRSEMEAELRRHGRSRVPVYRERRENIVGVLIVKDFLLNPDQELSDVLQPPIMVRPRYRADALLREFRHQRQHLAVVRHNDKLVGLVTLEDVLEEIFGEIYDERDTDPVEEKE